MTRQHTRRGAEIQLDRGADWRDEALCRGEDPELFFPHESESGQGAKDVCARCAVRQQCLDWAIEQKQEYGIWGGESAKARKRIAKAAGKHTTHNCVECGAVFTSAPTTRPKYCPDCRPIVHRRSKQMRQAARNERRTR